MTIRLIDLFTPSRWRSFYIHLVRKHLKWLDQSEWTPEVYEVEQFMFRYLSCPECMAKKECVHCGCNIPERMHVRTDYCSAYKWGEFQTEEVWNKYKEDYKVNFLLVTKDSISNE